MYRAAVRFFSLHSPWRSSKPKHPQNKKASLLRVALSNASLYVRPQFCWPTARPLLFKNSLISSVFSPISSASKISVIHSVSNSSKIAFSLITFFPPKYNLYSRQSGHHSEFHLRPVTLRPCFSTCLPLSVPCFLIQLLWILY
jgi:hypothetical protein